MSLILFGGRYRIHRLDQLNVVAERLDHVPPHTTKKNGRKIEHLAHDKWTRLGYYGNFPDATRATLDDSVLMELGDTKVEHNTKTLLCAMVRLENEIADFAQLIAPLAERAYAAEQECARLRKRLAVPND